MTSNSPNNTFYVKEFNPEIIAPNTESLAETESFGGSKTFVIGKPGCFTKNTQILMYNGAMKNIQDVKVGDVVMGDDSTPRNVIELCNNFDEMFKIVPSRGESYTVNKQHKLVLKSSSGCNKIKKGEIIEITVENYLKESKTFKNRMKIFRTQVEFNYQKVDLDPYQVGYSFSDNISREYLINTRDIRFKLLAGILEDNCVYENNSLKYNSLNRNIDDVVLLARTLGFLVIKDNNNCYISGNLNEIPFKNFSKFQQHNVDENILETDFEIEPQGEGEYFGFTLDGNHRFLLGTCDVVRNTGKSTIIASLLYAKKHIFPAAIVFSGSEDSNGFFRKIMPSTFVFNEYNEDQLKSFIRRQKIAKQHLQNPWCVCILDDCTDDTRVFNTPLQQGIFKRGRHWACWYIVSLQYAMDVKPVIRTNVDGVFLLREPILKNRKSLWENYASIIPDFTTFCTLMDELTSDYCCMYISNQTKTNDWRDCVYWYKAPIIPEGWKFGCPEYHQFHKDRFNEDYVDPFD
jgi:hypothetical protein